MASSQEAIPITRGELAEYLERASRALAAVKWAPKPGLFTSRQQLEPGAKVWRESAVAPPQPEELSILKAARRISGDPILFTDTINHVLGTIRLGIQLGAHLSRLYARASNLDVLAEQNRRNALSEGQKAEFRAKYQTGAAIALFGCAYYVAHDLAAYTAGERNGTVDFQGVPEVSLKGPVEAIDCALFYYAAYLEKSGAVATERDLVAITRKYFEAVLEELKLRAGSLEYTEPFTERTYKLGESEFSVRGFETYLGGGAASVEFNRVDIAKIVGNRDAKLHARRLAERIVCYRPETKRNIMHELGGFPDITLGYGMPGTGKSMMIAATATLIDDYCRQLSLPFLFHPLPDTIISTFQGGSGERMYEWMHHLTDPTRIIYAPIDDAENNLEERTRQGVSAGVREVIGVFLRNTEGAGAVKYGNWAIGVYTNIPEQIDRAVMSRIVARAFIGGAESAHDFLDQDYLWWKRYRELEASFIDMEDPLDYVYLENQRLVGSLTQVYGDQSEPSEEHVRVIFERVRAQYKPTTQVFFAEFFTAVKREFPLFSSRDLRNIQRAVDGRIMDFDMPAEWFENPEIFFQVDHERQIDMTKELMRGTMRGLSFAQVRLQEAIRYLDNMVRIADQARERRIAELIEQADLATEAHRRRVARDGTT